MQTTAIPKAIVKEGFAEMAILFEKKKKEETKSSGSPENGTETTRRKYPFTVFTWLKNRHGIDRGRAKLMIDDTHKSFTDHERFTNW